MSHQYILYIYSKHFVNVNLLFKAYLKSDSKQQFFCQYCQTEWGYLNLLQATISFCYKSTHPNEYSTLQHCRVYSYIIAIQYIFFARVQGSGQRRFRRNAFNDQYSKIVKLQQFLSQPLAENLHKSVRKDEIFSQF